MPDEEELKEPETDSLDELADKELAEDEDEDALGVVDDDEEEVPAFDTDE
jgi:hypothetical protein